MRLYYLDTSALLKRYKYEPGTENIDELFSQSLSTTKNLITSVFTIVEFASTGNRLIRANSITRKTYEHLMKKFAEDAETMLHIISMDDAIVLNAVEKVNKHHLRPGDALHLASVERNRDRLKGYDLEVIFVASDIALCSAASNEGFSVLNPERMTSEEWKKSLILSRHT